MFLPVLLVCRRTMDPVSTETLAAGRRPPLGFTTTLGPLRTRCGVHLVASLHRITLRQPGRSARMPTQTRRAYLDCCGASEGVWRIPTRANRHLRTRRLLRASPDEQEP